MAESKPAVASLTRPCLKCRAQEATLDSRSHPVCRDCFTKFIATKCIKQIGLLGKETRPTPSPADGPPNLTRRYLLGLSLGVSSTVLLHLLNENVEFQLAKGRNAPFELIVIYIDTSSQTSTTTTTTTTTATIERALSNYRTRYPRFTFHSVPLSPALPAPNSDAIPPAKTTTVASRTDIRRQLTRRALLAQAAAHNCQALLLGHSTTALAELTLAEAAKGRGFALPWLVCDGAAPASPSPAVLGEGGDGDGDGDDKANQDGNGDDRAGDGRKDAASVLVYHPLRDALRKELVTYAGLVHPPLTDLTVREAEKEGNGNGAVVSHKDLSIEEVMTRYFAEVEESYPSVVANVARTTGKLVRAGEHAGADGCGLCGMPLDEDGDERWKGELNIQSGPGTSSGLWRRLCYGCERSTGG